jgi:hypothetical protein
MKALLAGLLFVCTSAHAVYENGNMVLRDIEGSGMNQMYALGYIVGVADALNNADTVCIPTTVTKGQLNDVVHIYLKNRPQIRDLPATILIMLALSEYWACDNKPKRKKS